MPMMRLGVAACFVVLCVAPCSAWWDAGHQITASIAFRRLSPEQRERVLAVLRAHPRWTTDFEQAMPDSVRSADAAMQAEWAFQQAAVWPDLARKFDRANRDRYHHATWHYVNLPHFLTDADRRALVGSIEANFSVIAPATPAPDMNIVQTIRLSRNIVADRSQPIERRAEMLMWLFHTVGDIHQPLHSTTLFSQRLLREGCRGGNLIKTKQRGNLHSLWDSLPGENLSPREARNQALLLMNRADLSMQGERAARELDESSWLKESHELAVSTVYDSEVVTPLRAAESDGARELPLLTLSEDYLKTAGRAADYRIVAAGYRLGAVLAELTK
jgi:hypothetical protein